MKFIVIAAALVAAGAPACASETLAGPYTAEILRVIDGDTVEARIHLWLEMDLVTRVRLRGMNAPELGGTCPEAGRAARAALVRLLGQGPVTLTRIAYDKYGGRIDAAVLLPDGRDASTAMLSAGHAQRWPGAKEGACR